MENGRVLLVEDDDQMASLISLLVETASPGTRVERCVDVTDAEARFSPQRHCLVLCDWNLPGRPGISLLPTIRAAQPRVPVLMITGRTDRASVVTARAQGVDGFIGKPFVPERIVEKLRPYLQHEVGASPSTADNPGLNGWLDRVNDRDLEDALSVDRDALALISGTAEPPPLAELVKRWTPDPVLAPRLVAIANSSAFNPNARLCTSLAEALQRLGWRMASNIAATLALRRGVVFQDAALQECAEQQLSFAERVAEKAVTLARKARLDPAPLQSAALLHRIGELAVLCQLQRYQTSTGSTVDDAELDAALASRAAGFAERLMALWIYPMPLRQLVAAVVRLPPGTVKPDSLVLRLAGASVYGDLAEEELAKLRRMLFGEGEDLE